MMAGFPAGGALAAVIAVWLGTTASIGQHARPGRLARLARAAWELRNGWPVHDDLDDDDDPDSLLPPPVPEHWQAALDNAKRHMEATHPAISPDEWAAAMLRKSAPHLFSPDWYRTQRIEHIRWATMLWEEIRTMKREAGMEE